MADELEYVCKEAFEGVNLKEAKSDPEHVLISGKLANCNKQDAMNPKCRCRFVGQEVNVNGEHETAFYAATPPLEAKRLLMSQWARERKRDGHDIKLHCIDVRKAYFNARPKRSIYIRLPQELGLGRGVVGRLKRCIYGTRDAAALWESTYTNVLTDMGFTQGISNPCVFHHRAWGLALVAHGDDFTTLGPDWALDRYERKMQEAFDVELRGRLGIGPNDVRELKLLNRIIKVDEEGLTYEADPRHTELLARALGFENCGHVSTPGAKNCKDEVVADGKSPVENTDDMTECLHSRMPTAPPTSRMKFSEDVEVINVPSYADTFGYHPRDFILTGPIGNVSSVLLYAFTDPCTGLPRHKHASLCEAWAPDVQRRKHVLHDVLLEGAAWETPATKILAALQKRYAKTYIKKRVGARQARHLEQPDKAGDTLTPDEQTMYRALAARTLYLSLDRPDTTYATKDVCRDFSNPDADNLIRLKRSVRYLWHHRRLVWRYGFEDASNSVLDVYSDTDFGGCLRTRRSTSGGLACIGTHVLKGWSKTQSTVALGSAEAELTGVCAAASEGLGLQALCADLGLQVSLGVHSDATAAIGVCKRRGIGKIRHLAVADVWIQDKLRTGDFELCKNPRPANPADVLTKHVEWPLRLKHLAAFKFTFQDGRSELAAHI